MPNDFTIDVAITLLGVALCRQLKKYKRNRKYKTKNTNQKRKQEGFYYVHISKMKMLDEQQFFMYTRMDRALFEKLLYKLKPLIKKRSLPDSVLVEERLALTLHYLSQGASMQSMACMYHLGLTTVHQIIHETSSAIWMILHEEYVKVPSTYEEWLDIAKDFQNLRHFPNCIGALDGKYISMHMPVSESHLRKKDSNIVLLACCDAKLRFTMIDIGTYGSQKDGIIFKHSIFGEMLDAYLMNVPESSSLPNTNISHPYTIVAHQAFPLKSHIMRPYPGKKLTNAQRIFNFRLAQARKVIENALGILVNRWRILNTKVIVSERNVDILVKATVALHNYILEENIKSNESFYAPSDFIDSDAETGSWREDIEPLMSVGRLSANRSSTQIYRIRDELKLYFVSPQGEVPWQYSIINS